jgi:AraC-like DNA-binding protein
MGRFAQKFTSLVGEPPLSYLTRWRMQKATQVLRRADSTIAMVAHTVGYEADASFAKAFKREIGVAPGKYRAPIKTGGRGQGSRLDAGQPRDDVLQGVGDDRRPREPVGDAVKTAAASASTEAPTAAFL